MTRDRVDYASKLVDLAAVAYLFSHVARLLWRDAQGIEGSLEMASTEIKVGRAMDCAIRTDDAMVSRHHARVFWGGGGYVLEDLSSANGVYFQEQRVQSHLFKHGDAVRCGSLWLRFVDTGQAQVGGSAGPAPSNDGAPMMQHHGMGAIAPAGPTGHVAAVGGLPMSGAVAVASTPAAPSMGPSEADVEILVLRRRVEQLQTELRVYRANKFNQDTARRMGIWRTPLDDRDRARQPARPDRPCRRPAGLGGRQREGEARRRDRGDDSRDRRALNDLLSSLRIEVMAAEGEFEQFAHNLPRASFELIRQSLREAAGHCDAARELLRKLREVAE